MRILAASLCLAVVVSSNFREAFAQDNSICTLAPGQQARIAEIRVRDGATYVQIERARRVYRVTSNCLIQGGDVVRPLAGSTVTVVMPSGESAVADVDHPLAIPVSAPASRWANLYQVLQSYLGDNLEMANAMANVKAAQGRALERVDDTSPIVIPGLPAVARQNVTSGQPILLRWLGGRGPYSVRLQAGDTGKSASWTASTHQLDIPAPAPGNYTLSISCTGCTALNIPLRAAPESDMPSSPDISKLAPEDRSAVEAVWLLSQGSNEWRLEALSRLQSQARDHGNVIAQAILTQTAP